MDREHLPPSHKTLRAVLTAPHRPESRLTSATRAPAGVDARCLRASWRLGFLGGEDPKACTHLPPDGLLPEWPQPRGGPPEVFPPPLPTPGKVAVSGTRCSLAGLGSPHPGTDMLLACEPLTSPHRPGQRAASSAHRSLTGPKRLCSRSQRQIPGSGPSGTHPAGCTCPQEAHACRNRRVTQCLCP